MFLHFGLTSLFCPGSSSRPNRRSNFTVRWLCCGHTVCSPVIQYAPRSLSIGRVTKMRLLILMFLNLLTVLTQIYQWQKGQHRSSSYKDVTHPTSPRSVCRIYSTTWPSDREGGERLGELHLCNLKAGAVPSITNIYSLVSTLSFFCLTPSQNYPLRRKACLLKSMQHLHEREILATAEKSPVKYQYGQKISWHCPFLINLRVT